MKIDEEETTILEHWRKWNLNPCFFQPWRNKKGGPIAILKGAVREATFIPDVHNIIFDPCRDIDVCLYY